MTVLSDNGVVNVAVGSLAVDAGAWQRVRPLRASDEIVRTFRKALFEGALAPGDAIGSESQLSARFSVSRSTIRDALRTLEASGVVEIRTGVKGGARIAQGDPYRFAEGLAVQLKLIGLRRSDALAAQLGLEWVAAELAAGNATEAERLELRRLLEESEASIEGGAGFTGFAFHQAVARAAHNWAIDTCLRAIHELLWESRPHELEAERARAVVDLHRSIYEAIARRDGALAGTLMRRHIGVTQAATRLASAASDERASSADAPATRRLPVDAPGRQAWERVRPVRASDEIVRQFRTALFQERFRAGEPIGSEHQLAEQFGVSRTTVRDALRTLEAGGLVEIRTGVAGGVRVSRGDPYRFADGLAVQLKLMGLQPGDAMAAEMGLEWVAAELAAVQATAQDAAALEGILRRSERLLDAGSAFAEASMAFHDAVASASHNWAVITGLRAIREVVGESHARTTTPERARRVVGVHREIVEAIAAGEGERAGELMRQHIGLARAASITSTAQETACCGAPLPAEAVTMEAGVAARC